MYVRSIVRVLAVLAALAAEASAQAQAPRPVSAERAARAYFENGVTLVEAKRYDDALGQFRAGYELSGRPLFLFNMGECARLAERPATAREYYQRYLSADPGGAFASTARARLDELSAAAPPAPPPPRIPTPAEAVRDREPSPPPPTAIAHVEAGRWGLEPVWRHRWPIAAGVGAALLLAVSLYALSGDGGGAGCTGSCAIVDLR